MQKRVETLTQQTRTADRAAREAIVTLQPVEEACAGTCMPLSYSPLVGEAGSSSAQDW